MDDEWFRFFDDVFQQDWFEHEQLTQTTDHKWTEIQTTESTSQSQSQLQLQLQVDIQCPVHFTHNKTQNQSISHSGLHSERQRTTFPVEAQCELTDWIMKNHNCPFASKEVENHFIVKYGMTRKQVKTAFNNRRQRLLAPFRLKMQTTIG
jgi:hypothetical protein